MSETSKHQPKSPVDIGIAEPETAASSMDVPEGEAQSLVALSEDGISNSLDHALLESLFYNEMALMDDFSEFLYSSSSGMGGSSVGGTVAAGEATNPTHSANTSNHDSGSTNLVTQARTTNTPLDSSLAVETDLLRHFGIAHASPELNPIITATGAAAPPQLLTDNHHQHVTSTAPVNVMSHPPKVVASSTTAIETTPTKSPSFVPPPVDAHQQRLNLQAVAASGRRGIRHNVVVVVPPQNNSVVCAQTPSTAPQPLPIPSIATSCASLNNNSLLPKTETESLSNCPPPTANNNQNSDNNTIHNNNNNNELASDMEKRSKLVTQFATLAGRLGITLPPQVLHKLTTTTHAAATGPSSHVAQPPLLPPPPIASVAPDSAANAFAIANPNGSIIIESCAVLPTSTATDVATLTATSAAIVPTSVASFGTDSSPALATAQVSSSTVGLESSGVKRPAESSILDTNLPRSDSAVDLSSHNKGGGPYSKRRKKPRLSDCERRLAQLVAEQALLQSQCNAMANRKDALDAERIAAETHMRTILQQDAPAQELDAAVQNFTELYSDYGRKRHEELIFHLEQLQRYVPLNGIYVVDKSEMLFFCLEYY